MKRRLLAPAVVITVATAACGPQRTANPPPPSSDPSTQPESHHQHAADPVTTETETETGTETETTAAANIHRDEEGRCWVHPDVDCPPPDEGTCNPPGPEEVDCETGQPK